MLEKLKAKGYLVLDGAMGSNLFLLGLISGDSPEAWYLEHPDRVKKVHQAFVQAGSDHPYQYLWRKPSSSEITST